MKTVCTYPSACTYSPLLSFTCAGHHCTIAFELQLFLTSVYPQVRAIPRSFMRAHFPFTHVNTGEWKHEHVNGEGLKLTLTFIYTVVAQLLYTYIALSNTYCIIPCSLSSPSSIVRTHKAHPSQMSVQCIYHLIPHEIPTLLSVLERTQELDRLRESLEEVESSTVAQQEIRTQRENELAVLKKTLEDEVAAHEDAVAGLRSKHSKAMEELNEQLEAAKKVCVSWSMRACVYIQL